MHAVIVGAGIIGLSTAFELRCRGHSVTVIDPAPAQAASRAAAGMLAPAAETTWGSGPLHRLLAASNAAYPQFVDKIEKYTGRRPDYLRNSTLVIAAEPADRQALHELVELQRSLGFDAQPLLPSAARRLEPALASNLAGAVRCADDHQIDPRSVTGILIDYLRGDLVRENVAELVREAGVVRAVRTDAGRLIEGDQIILCTGLAQLDSAPALPLRAVYGDILRLQTPAGPPLITHTIRAVVHRQPVYLVPRRDGSIVLGASSREDANPKVNVGQMHRLLDDAKRILPGIVDCSLNEVIARARPGTPDDRPMVGRVEEQLILSTGYSCHGVLLTPLGSTVTADLAEGKEPDVDLNELIDPRRFAAAAHHDHLHEGAAP